jgi:hypothetical protein
MQPDDPALPHDQREAFRQPSFRSFDRRFLGTGGAVLTNSEPKVLIYQVGVKIKMIRYLFKTGARSFHHRKRPCARLRWLRVR